MATLVALPFIVAPMITGVLLYVDRGNAAIACVVFAVFFIATYKLGDWLAPKLRRFAGPKIPKPWTAIEWKSCEGAKSTVDPGGSKYSFKFWSLTPKTHPITFNVHCSECKPTCLDHLGKHLKTNANERTHDSKTAPLILKPYNQHALLRSDRSRVVTIRSWSFSVRPKYNGIDILFL